MSFNYTPFKTLTMSMAQWLINESRWPDEEMRGHWINITILNGVKLGNLEVVKFLYPFQEYEIGGFMFMEKAAECGCLDILKWLHDQGADYSSHGTDMAARNGHLEVVQWFHTRLPETVTSSTLKYAAEGGHLEVFQWLYELGSIVLDAQVVREAVSHGQLEVLDYVVAHADRSQWWTGDEMTTALQSEQYEVADWLIVNDLDGPISIHTAVRTGILSLIQEVLRNAKPGSHLMTLGRLHRVKVSLFLSGCFSKTRPF